MSYLMYSKLLLKDIQYLYFAKFDKIHTTFLHIEKNVEFCYIMYIYDKEGILYEKC